MVARDLAAAGTSLDFVAWDTSGRLGTYFVEFDAGPTGVSVIYDRQGSSCSAMTSDDLPWAEIDRARLVHLTGITPALSASCRTATEAVAAIVRDTETMLSVDVNYRAKLWSSAEARRCLEGLAAGADLLICAGEDAKDVFGIVGEPLEVVSGLADRLGTIHTVVTSGAAGAVWWHAGDSVAVAAMATTIVDRLGAGDAFAAGVIDGLLDGSVAEGLRRGTALAATALATRGDQVTITRPDLMAMLESGRRTLDR
jgi:2-dehydro-3-deoxygluconokinase